MPLRYLIENPRPSRRWIDSRRWFIEISDEIIMSGHNLYNLSSETIRLFSTMLFRQSGHPVVFHPLRQRIVTYARPALLIAYDLHIPPILLSLLFTRTYSPRNILESR